MLVLLSDTHAAPSLTSLRVPDSDDPYDYVSLPRCNSCAALFCQRCSAKFLPVHKRGSLNSISSFRVLLISPVCLRSG